MGPNRTFKERRCGKKRVLYKCICNRGLLSSARDDVSNISCIACRRIGEWIQQELADNDSI